MDDTQNLAPNPDDPQRSKGWADRNPKLSILLIAAVFYVILFSMCAFVVVLLIRG